MLVRKWVGQLLLLILYGLFSFIHDVLGTLLSGILEMLLAKLVYGRD